MSTPSNTDILVSNHESEPTARNSSSKPCECRLTLKDDLFHDIIDSNDLDVGYCVPTKRSINDNTFDEVYQSWKNSSASGSTLEKNGYSYILPLFTGGWNFSEFRSLFCGLNGSNSKAATELIRDMEMFAQTATKAKDLINDRCGCLQGTTFVSFFIENTKDYGNVVILINLNIMHRERGYNVYLIDSDKFLLDSNINNDNMFGLGISKRGILFDNRIIILMRHPKLCFYDLSDLTQPKLMGAFDLYHVQWQHQMVCTGKKNKNEMILLFFGGDGRSIQDSFTKVSIKYDLEKYDETDKKSFNRAFNIECEKVLASIASGSESMVGPAGELFGITTVINSKNERIVIAVRRKSILLFNCVTNELVIKNNILPYYCQYSPSLINHHHHIHVLSKKKHFIINTNRLLSDFGFGQLKSLDNFLFWEQERIIWIGFKKNIKNRACIFARRGFSYDITCHVLSFLKHSSAK